MGVIDINWILMNETMVSIFDVNGDNVLNWKDVTDAKKKWLPVGSCGAGFLTGFSLDFIVSPKPFSVSPQICGFCEFEFVENGRSSNIRLADEGNGNSCKHAFSTWCYLVV
jgi:hypothetical protein